MLNSSSTPFGHSRKDPSPGGNWTYPSLPLSGHSIQIQYPPRTSPYEITPSPIIWLTGSFTFYWKIVYSPYLFFYLPICLYLSLSLTKLLDYTWNCKNSCLLDMCFISRVLTEVSHLATDLSSPLLLGSTNFLCGESMGLFLNDPLEFGTRANNNTRRNKNTTDCKWTMKLLQFCLLRNTILL